MTNTNLERFLLYVESKNKDCDENNDHNNDYMKRRYHRSESDLHSLSKDSFHDGQKLQHQRQGRCDNDDDHEDDDDLLAMAKRLEEECSISSDMCYTRSDKSTRTIEASSTVSTSRTSPIAYTSMSTNTTNTVDNTKINNNNNWRSDRGTLDPVDPEGVLDFNFDTFNKSDPDGIVNDDDGCYDERGDNNNTLFYRRRRYTATGQYGRNKKIPPLPYKERKERLWKSEGGHCWGDNNKGVSEDYIVNEYWRPVSTGSRGRHRTKRTSPMSTMKKEGDDDDNHLHCEELSLKDINEEDEKDYYNDHQEQQRRKSWRSPTLKGTNEMRDHNDDVLYRIPARRSSDAGGASLYTKQRQQHSLPRRSESDGVKSSSTLYETYPPRRKNSNTSNHSSRQCRNNSTSSSYGSRSTNRRGGRQMTKDRVSSSSSFKQQHRNVSASESYNDDGSISSCSSSHSSCSISSQLSKNERCNEYYSSEVDSDSDCSVEVLGVAEAVQYLNENNKVEKVVTVANAIRGKIRSKFLSSQLP